MMNPPHIESMTKFDAWLDGINTNIASKAGSAVNVPRVVVIHSVRSTVRDFLADTHVWTYNSNALARTSDTRTMSLPRDTYICKVWPIKAWPCFSHRLSHTHPNIIKIKDLSDAESNSQALNTIDVSLSVTQDSLECPTFIYDRFYDGILSGVLARLQAMPGKEWSDPNMVSYHNQVFEEAKRKAKSDLASSFNKARDKHDIKPNYM